MRKVIHAYIFAILLTMNCSLSSWATNYFDDLPSETISSHIYPSMKNIDHGTLGQVDKRFNELTLKFPCEDEITIDSQSALNKLIASSSAQKRLRNLKLSNNAYMLEYSSLETSYNPNILVAQVIEHWESDSKQQDAIADLSQLYKLMTLTDLELEDGFPNPVLSTLALPSKLQKLVINGAFATGESIKGIKLPITLKQLILREYDFQTIEDESPFTTCMPTLKTFYLSAPRSIPPSKLREKVTSLFLSAKNRGQNRGAIHFGYVIDFPNLEELEIDRGFPEPWFAHMPFPSKLKKLTVECFNLSSQALARLKFPKSLESLTVIDADLAPLNDISNFFNINSFKLIAPRTLPTGELKNKVTDITFAYRNIPVSPTLDFSTLNLFENLYSFSFEEYLKDEHLNKVTFPSSLKDLTVNCSSLSAEWLRDWSVPASLTHLILNDADLHLLDDTSTFILSLPKLKFLKIERPRALPQEGLDLSQRVESLYLDKTPPFSLEDFYNQPFELSDDLAAFITDIIAHNDATEDNLE